MNDRTQVHPTEPPPPGSSLTIQLRAGLPVAEVHARLRHSRRLRDVGPRALAFHLADMDRRGLHEATGHATTACYAEEHLHLAPRRTRELVAVGRALAELPAIDAAFMAGALSWSKVMLLARVATPEHEASWLERAQASTCRELRLAVRLAGPGIPPPAPDEAPGRPEETIEVQIELDARTRGRVERARAKLSAMRGEPIDDAQLVCIFAELILARDDDGSSAGRPALRAL